MDNRSVGHLHLFFSNIVKTVAVTFQYRLKVCFTFILILNSQTDTQQFCYDNLNRLTWSPTLPGKTVNYLYDGEGHRVAMLSTVSGTTTLTSYRGVGSLRMFSHHPVDGNKVGSLMELVFMGLFMSSLFTFGYVFQRKKRS